VRGLVSVFYLSLLLVGVAPAADSLNCRWVGAWPFGPSSAVALDSARDLAFVASGGGVYVLDVTDPARPVELSEAIRTRGVVLGLGLRSNRLCVAANEAGLEIWDVSVPSGPSFMGRLDTPGQARGVAVAGSHAYVAGQRAGLQVFQFNGVGVEETPSPEVRTSHRGPTIVRGVLFLPSSVLSPHSSLLSVAGRNVMELRPGPNDVSRLAPGLYFVRAVSREPSAVGCQKVVIQR